MRLRINIALLLISLFSLFTTEMATAAEPVGYFGTVNFTGIRVLPPTTGSLSATLMVGAGAAAISAPATLTTATATQLCALFPAIAAGQFFSWDWIVRNTAAGADTLTIAAGSGVTLSGTMTVAQNYARSFKVSITGCKSTPAALIISTGTSAF